MIKTIAFHILKGGSSKSTNCGNIAFSLAKQGKKTIAVDCDYQSNLSKWFIVKPIEFDLGDVLQGKIEVKKAMCQITDNFYIIPVKNKSDLKNYAETKLFQEPFVFEELIVELNKLGFDFALFDLAPSISQLERSILLSVNEVITPMLPEYFSYDGITLFEQELNKVNKSFRKNVKHNKIVVSCINESFRRHKSYLHAIEGLSNRYKIYKISQDSKIPESQMFNKSIFDYAPNSKTIKEIELITNDILAEAR